MVNICTPQNLSILTKMCTPLKAFVLYISCHGVFFSFFVCTCAFASFSYATSKLKCNRRGQCWVKIWRCTPQRGPTGRDWSKAVHLPPPPSPKYRWESEHLQLFILPHASFRGSAHCQVRASAAKGGPRLPASRLLKQGSWVWSLAVGTKFTSPDCTLH